MFDPTAYENIKVVVEGALYDRDLDGDIIIVDRDDIINTAKLSRTYVIIFSESKDAPIRCRFVLEANLENLTAELHPSSLNSRLAGVHASVQFIVKHKEQNHLNHAIQETLLEVWGSDRLIEQKVSYNPLNRTDFTITEITVLFNRLIKEDQIDDLLVMVDYMISSLKKLNNILS